MRRTAFTDSRDAKKLRRSRSAAQVRRCYVKDSAPLVPLVPVARADGVGLTYARVLMAILPLGSKRATHIVSGVRVASPDQLAAPSTRRDGCEFETWQAGQVRRR